MVNDRQRRNWDKIERFEREVKGMVYEEGRGGRKHYDVVGDVAVVKDVEVGGGEGERVGAEIMER